MYFCSLEPHSQYIHEIIIPEFRLVVKISLQQNSNCLLNVWECTLFGLLLIGSEFLKLIQPPNMFKNSKLPTMCREPTILIFPLKIKMNFHNQPESAIIFWSVFCQNLFSWATDGQIIVKGPQLKCYLTWIKLEKYFSLPSQIWGFCTTS